ncbi:MAG: class I SAM-dependent methyltransferase [Acidimicrobiales bacterium]
MRAETAGFEKASHEYDRGRPGYPPDCVDWIVHTALLGPGKTVVDLAAGTGKLTVELLGSGAEVIAVEPLGEMRARLVGRVPHIRVVDGMAERTGLANETADAVTVAQAFHWFANDEALAEIQRILKPRGILFLVWNRRDLVDTVQAAISRLTSPYVGEVPSYASGQWKAVMASSECFEPVGEHQTSITQLVDRQGIVDRVASTSYIASLPDEARVPLLKEIAELVPAGGTVSLPYSTSTHAFRRR